MKPPKSDLDLLIDVFEKEQRSLKKMIRKAASEHDNLIVYYHSESLLDLNSRLRVLYNFRDPNFEQKEKLRRGIDFWRKSDFIKKARPQLRQSMKKKNNEKAADLEGQLQQLINGPQPQPLPDTQFIDEALLALYENRCRSFRLILGEPNHYGITLTFRIRKKILTIVLKGDFFGEEPDFIFDGRISQPLKAAGFSYNQEQKTYVRTFAAAGAHYVPEIKKWLAKFIIEDGWYYWPGRTMSLVYK